MESTLWKLDLSGRSLGSSGSLDIINTIDIAAASVLPGKKLTVLDLSNNQLPPSSAASLAHIFRKYPNIRRLNLANNRLGSVGIEQFAEELLKTARSSIVIDGEALPISFLDLSNNGFDDSCTPAVAAAFIANGKTAFPRLDALVLRSNPIGDLGATDIAEAITAAMSMSLSTTPSKSSRYQDSGLVLRLLDLSKCNIGSDGAEFLCNVVNSSQKAGCQLRVLGLPIHDSTQSPKQSASPSMRSIGAASGSNDFDSSFMLSARSRRTTSVSESAHHTNRSRGPTETEQQSETDMTAYAEHNGSPARTTHTSDQEEDEGDADALSPTFSSLRAPSVDSGRLETTRTHVSDFPTHYHAAHHATTPHGRNRLRRRSYSIDATAVEPPFAAFSMPSQASPPTAGLSVYTTTNNETNNSSNNNTNSNNNSNHTTSTDSETTGASITPTQDGHSADVTLAEAVPQAAIVEKFNEYVAQRVEAAVSERTAALEQLVKAMQQQLSSLQLPGNATTAPNTSRSHHPPIAEAASETPPSSRVHQQQVNVTGEDSRHQGTSYRPHYPIASSRPAESLPHTRRGNPSEIVYKRPSPSQPGKVLSSTPPLLSTEPFVDSAKLWEGNLRFERSPADPRRPASPASANRPVSPSSARRFDFSTTGHPARKQQPDIHDEADERVVQVDIEHLDDSMLLDGSSGAWDNLPPEYPVGRHAPASKPRGTKLHTTAYDRSAAGTDEGSVAQSDRRSTRTSPARSRYSTNTSTHLSPLPAVSLMDSHTRRQNTSLRQVEDRRHQARRNPRSPSPSLGSIRATSPRSARAIAEAAARGIPPALMAHAMMNPVSLGQVTIKERVHDNTGGRRSSRRASLSEAVENVWEKSAHLQAAAPPVIPIGKPSAIRSSSPAYAAAIAHTLVRGGSVSGQSMAVWGASLRSGSPPSGSKGGPRSPKHKVGGQFGVDLVTSAERVLRAAEAVESMNDYVKKQQASVERLSSTRLRPAAPPAATSPQKSISPARMKAAHLRVDLHDESKPQRTSSPSKSPPIAAEMPGWKEAAIRQIAATPLFHDPAGKPHDSAFL